MGPGGPQHARAGTKRCAIRFLPPVQLQTDEAERMDRSKIRDEEVDGKGGGASLNLEAAVLSPN